MERIALFRPAVRTVLLWSAAGLAGALAMAAAGTAHAVVERTVRWAASPLRDEAGHSLPPAAAYEVWLSADARAESLVAVATDTLQALILEPGVSYVVRVRAVAAGGAKSAFSEPSDPFEVPKAIADAPVPDQPPVLGPAWPNPFNARVTLAYEVPAATTAGQEPGLAIHDLRGRRVASLALDRRPGRHTIEWNATDAQGRRLPSGIYVAQYVCGRVRATLRLVLVS